MGFERGCEYPNCSDLAGAGFFASKRLGRDVWCCALHKQPMIDQDAREHEAALARERDRRESKQAQGGLFNDSAIFQDVESKGKGKSRPRDWMLTPEQRRQRFDEEFK